MIMPKMRVAVQKKCPEDTDFIISFYNAKTSELWGKMYTRKECGILLFGKPDESPEDMTLGIESKDFCLLLRRSGMQQVKYEL